MSGRMRAADTVAAVGEAAATNAQKGIDQTVATLKDGMAQAAAGFEKTQAKVKEGWEKAMRTAEEYVQFGQGNYEAFLQSGQIWAAGVQDLSRQVAASAQSSVEESVATFRAVAAARSVREAIELQSSYVRSAVEKTVADSSRIADASVKLFEQALAPLTARMALAVEKFAKPAV
ncbi:MAG: phasin family protein [Acetobacteraceae bacterium]|nr:phasin family protein [Acetobacteraceae bacterium]